MKDKLKDKGDTLKGLIRTGGTVMDKALDKGSEVAVLMIENMTKLTSKLSDDIGVMADRILTMEERIGNMADRIVHTEELMARLTATLANRELAVAETSVQPGAMPPLLAISANRISIDTVPDLRIAGDPDAYLLYVSRSPVFLDGQTVVSRVAGVDDLSDGWRRSVHALLESRANDADRGAFVRVLSVAVRTTTGEHLSPLSNSVDLTIE